MPISQPAAAALPDYTPHELRDFGARIRAHRNESAFPLPDSILFAVRSVAEEDLRQYPSDRYVALGELAAGKLGVEPASMFFGNGSDDLIFAIAGAYLGQGTNAVTLQPTFGMYKRASLLRGAEVREVPYATRWRLDPAAVLRACDPSTRAIFLCSPNNPTCEVLDETDLATIANARPDALVVVDEAYLLGRARSHFGAVDCLDNVAVIATLSKIPGLAGLRCGFGAAAPDVARVLRRVMQPHPLTIPAVRAMEAYFRNVFEDRAYLASYEHFVSESLDRLVAELGPLSSGVTRGFTNFAVFEFGERATQLSAALEAQQILVRRLETRAFHGGIRINALETGQTRELIAAAKLALEPSYA